MKRRRNASLKLTMPVAAEAKEQEWLFQWKWSAGIRKWPELRWLHAIPNGMAASSIGAAARMKRQGMLKGIPDLFLPVARHGFHGLYVEMKRCDGTIRDLSKDQRECIASLQQQGYAVAIAYGWRDAVNLIEGYLTVDFSDQSVKRTALTRLNAGAFLTVECSSQPSTASVPHCNLTAAVGGLPNTAETGLTEGFCEEAITL